MAVGRRGLRIAGAALALLVLVVATLVVVVPALARRFVERRASAAFPGVVTIGDLDIGWWDASLRAEDVDVWAIDAPAAPLLRVKRLSLRIDLAALRHRELHVLEAVIERPDLHVERLADGRFSVEDLAPPAEPTPSPGPVAAAAAGPPWQFRVDTVRLHGGRVQFRDLAVEGSEALPIEIERIDLDRVALRAGPLPEPAALRVEARIGGAPVRLAIVATSLTPHLAFDATLDVTGLRLDGAAVVGEATGLESLTGALDAKLHHVFETDVASVLDGEVTLREIAVGGKPGEAGSTPLGFARLDAALGRVDLRARAAQIDRVTIAGATALVTPDGDTLLPGLARRAPAPAELPPDATAPPLAPWTFDVAQLVIDGARVRVQAKDAKPLDVTATLRADRIDAALAKPFPLTLEASAASGKATLRGDAQLEPPGFRGTLRLAGLDLARALAAAGAPGVPLAARVPGARADADLMLDFPPDDAAKPAAPEWIARGSVSLSAVARPPAPADEPALLTLGWEKVALVLDELRLASPFAPAERRGEAASRARGSLQVGGLEGVIAPQPGEPGLVVRWRSLDLALQELRLPDVFAGSGAGPVTARGQLGLAGFALADYAAERDSELGVAFERLDARLEELRLGAPPPEEGAEPTALRLERAALGSLRVDAPWLRVTRTRSGFSIPPALQGGSGGGAPAELSAAPVALVNGSARFVDQTVKPYYDVDFNGVRLEARALRSRGPTLEGVTLQMTSGRDARIRIEGGGDANGLTFVANASDVPLPPLNPYATVLGYDLQAGEASLVSSVWIGTEGIDAKNWLTLRQLAVRELTPGTFEKMAGVSLSLALDVLTDGDGKLELTLPVWWNAEGFGLKADETLRAATRQAIVGTLLLPLRKLGAVVGGKGNEPRIEPPPPIPFAAGSAELSPEAEARVRDLARFLASRPGVEVALEAQSATADGPDEATRRSLAERRLARVGERLREGYGVPARQLRTLPPGEGSADAGAEVRIRLDQA